MSHRGGQRGQPRAPRPGPAGARRVRHRGEQHGPLGAPGRRMRRPGLEGPGAPSASRPAHSRDYTHGPSNRLGQARWSMGAFLLGGGPAGGGAVVPGCPAGRAGPGGPVRHPVPGPGPGAGPGRCGIVPVVTGTGSHRAGLRAARAGARPAPAGSRPGPGPRTGLPGPAPGRAAAPPRRQGAPGAAGTSPRTAAGRPHPQPRRSATAPAKEMHPRNIEPVGDRDRWAGRGTRGWQVVPGVRGTAPGHAGGAARAA